MPFIQKLRLWAKELKKKLVVAHLASTHIRTPWFPKFILIITLAYALSPIDLVPDFIPVLGILDDLLIVPFGIWLGFRLIPKNIINECEELAENYHWNKKKNFVIAIFIILIWTSLFALLFFTYRERISNIIKA